MSGSPLSSAPALSPVTPDGGAATIRGCILRARRAFSHWGGLPVQVRAQHLERLRGRIAARSDELARQIVRETGKPITEAWGAEILGSLEALRTLIRLGPGWLAPQQMACSLLERLRGVTAAELRYEPLGVIGILGTWNYPLLIPIKQIAGALLAGNTVLYKPSERCPLTAELLEVLFRQAGLPESVFTTLPSEVSAGEALAQAGCDKLLLTGSARTGRRVLEALAASCTPAVMELSGMDAALVCRDAPLELTVAGLCWGGMTHGGQSCVAPRRILVHREIAPRFVPALAERLRSLRMGDPTDPGTQIGPLRWEDLLDRLESLVQEAVQAGARLLTGGGRVRLGGDSFFEPTLLTGIRPEMTIAREEFFGPVLLVEELEDDEAMVAQANRSPYGLGASVWSRNLSRARSLASRLEAGMVWVNDVLYSASQIRYPFGGVKASGYGRVGGAEGLRELTVCKTVEICRAGGFRPYYFPYSAGKLRQLRSFLRWRHGTGP